ncbi:multidrug effflux MFS transporter [uncultured Jatrophihabitans sp.]|uniref:multidrug effflux MFS transporter n=1 Tax=uncultured Jatrophihabitans sp. TaxID=1610747 RepID=UPI0035CA2644
MSDTAPTLEHRAYLLMLLVLGALAAFGPLSMDMYLPSLPSISDDLHTSATSTQFTMSACIAGLALGQLVAGPLSDALGRRRPLLVGVGAYVVLSLLCAAAPNVGVLIVLRLLQGLAGAAGLVISRAIVRDRWGGGPAAARVFSLLTLVSSIAPVASPLLGGQILRATSWRGVFVVLAAIGVLILLGTLTLDETHPPEQRQGSLQATGQAFGLLVRDRVFVCYTVAGGLAGAALFTYISASPFVIEDAYGRSAQLFSLMFAANSVGIMVTGRFSARLVQRVGSASLLRVGLVVQALAGVALLGVVAAGRPPLAVLLVPLFFIVAPIGLIGPNSTALALSPHGAIAGSASAQLGAFQFLVGAAVGPLAGVAGHESVVPMAVLIAVLSCGGLAATYAVRAPTVTRTPVPEVPTAP